MKARPLLHGGNKPILINSENLHHGEKETLMRGNACLRIKQNRHVLFLKMVIRTITTLSSSSRTKLGDHSNVTVTKLD